ncbi:MAG TPA: hypothetical protein VGN63_18825 [Flavisolibacter sp.]|jgi:endonuclease G|nr:hypothetical protein [Flavisolibacter sp.]
MAIKDFSLIKNYLMQFRHVEDVGIGFKEVDGVVTNELSIVVNVTEKVSPEHLPPVENIPAAIDGIPVDVVSYRLIVDEPVERVAVKDESRYSRMDPLVGGINIKNKKKNAGLGGTLGAFVTFSPTDKVYAITNWHVVKRPFWSAKNDPVVQPHKLDLDDGLIGYVRMLNEKLDIAFIELSGRAAATANKIYGIQGNIVGTTSPEVGMRVFKSGTRTGVTYGIITKVMSNYARVEPDPDVYGTADVEISSGGDSGSVWLYQAQEGELMAVLLHNLGEKNKLTGVEWASGIRMDVIQKVYAFRFL